MNVKVEVYRNRFVVTAGGVARVFTPTSPFTTERLLVGDFASAEECLKRAFKEMRVRSFFGLVYPDVLMCQKEMHEGGLSLVERRVLNELGMSAGGKRVEIQEG